MSKTFPRLLVATEFPPNGSGGGAAIARQMLKGWPVDKLFWWNCHPEIERRFGQQVAANRTAFIPPRLLPNRRLARPKSWLMENIWAPRAASHLRSTLAEFRPEAIWTIPHVWSIPPLARVLPVSGIGFHTSIHDYVDTQHSIATLGAARNHRLAAMADILYSCAESRDAISDSMVEDLRVRTGSTGIVSHMGLEQSDFDFLAKKSGKPQDVIRIAYAGTISTEATFILFVEALAAVRARLSKPVSIEIFSSHSYGDRPWFDISWMHERGNLPEPHFTNALRECAWGFSPMSLAEDDPRHRFSLSTKFISYIAAGLPVFTMGHPETGVVKMAKVYAVGACVDSAEPGPLREKMLEAFSLEDPWGVFGPEILRCARTELDATRMRQALHDSFYACARATLKTSNKAG